MSLRLSIVVFCLLALPRIGLAQENLGLHMSRYMPVNGIQLNPAFSADALVKADIHLLGASLFGENNHAFVAGDGPGFLSYVQGDTEAIEDLTEGPRSAYVDISIDGPGLSLVLGRSAIGFSTRSRSLLQVSTQDVSIARLVFSDFRTFELYDQDLRAENFNFMQLSWAELNLNFSHMVQVTESSHLNMGFTVKRLQGLTHFGVQVREADYMLNAQDLIISGFSGSYSYGASSMGLGDSWGLDLGLVYRKSIGGRPDYYPYRKESRCTKSQYRYQLGLSLLDYGSVRFRGLGATVEHEGTDAFWENYEATSTSNIEELSQNLTDRLEDDQNEVQRAASSRVGLPTGLSTQFDLNLDKGFFLGAVGQLPLRALSNDKARRATLLGFIPRYESQRFEASLPLSLYEFETFRAGFAFRYRYFSIGSSDLIALAFDQDLYSADFYGSLRIPVYGSKSCRNSKKGGRRKLANPCWGQ